ncbi:mechanosensitive ion channel, partial [Roseburia faecis]|nr:mechanosensitive ion channel [Roseburia faecis]
SYDADIDQVKKILTDIVSRDERVLKDRDITVRVNELGPSSVNFVVRAWSKSGDLQNVYWDVLEQIKKGLDANGIGIPYPQMDVHVRKT